MTLKGNKGEWSEIYIFLKLMSDRKIYAADKNMNKINNVFLNIIKIIREEIRNHVYEYYTGDEVKVHLNDVFTSQTIPESAFKENKDKLFFLMSSQNETTFGNAEIEDFLASIHIRKLKAPSSSSSGKFGGTQDILMTVMDYRSGITYDAGFSCKSDFAARATLFNASIENTNFLYEITGAIDDNFMNHVNSIFHIKNKKNKKTGVTEQKKEVATGKRIRALKEAGCDLNFISPCTETAKRNLVLSGGKELPEILAEAMRYFYWEGDATVDFAPFQKAISYVIDRNPAGYTFDNLESIYKKKFSDLLYNMFTGMRLGSPWDGKSGVNGGYVVMKDDGDVLAYHSCIEDEFKDFLLNRLGFEAPSTSRHKYIEIFKENGKYFIKLNLQVRFV
ncbi:MAG: HpaII family restriction endonuclease [Defluviitaleaceae bacterium]|nr:HpaII family restriction endonuclease [Defluviitaleaceae bacterium]